MSDIELPELPFISDELLRAVTAYKDFSSWKACKKEIQAYAAAHGEACYAAGVKEGQKSFMMAVNSDDITCRLREHDDPRLYTEADLLMCEASQEIIRLREELAALKQSLAQPSQTRFAGVALELAADGKIIVRIDGIGGYVAHQDENNIAATILFHLAEKVLAQQPAQAAVPEGYKLVPKKLSQEMGVAMAAAIFKGDQAVWDAALNAAPYSEGGVV